MKRPVAPSRQYIPSIIVLPKNQNHWLVLEDTICKPFRTEGTEAKELALNYARRRAQLINCEINVADRHGNITQTITRPVLAHNYRPDLIAAQSRFVKGVKYPAAGDGKKRRAFRTAR